MSGDNSLPHPPSPSFDHSLCGYPPFYSETDNNTELYDLTINNQWEFSSPDWDEVSQSGEFWHRRKGLYESHIPHFSLPQPKTLLAR